ncbi:hypothetical protein DI53_3482 [Sphingobacterium deserti]|uniref:Uncharacterized protein n=1 Tax=Sphingobacterium deserti TaxID=1229276 RepID=A0A0B8T1X9_9SPHI|nr:hypothetical protein DI53_3482 [Sphingobacterium deserti]
MNKSDGFAPLAFHVLDKNDNATKKRFRNAESKIFQTNNHPFVSFYKPISILGKKNGK